MAPATVKDVDHCLQLDDVDKLSLANQLPRYILAVLSLVRRRIRAADPAWGKSTHPYETNNYGVDLQRGSTITRSYHRGR